MEHLNSSKDSDLLNALDNNRMVSHDDIAMKSVIERVIRDPAFLSAVAELSKGLTNPELPSTSINLQQSRDIKIPQENFESGKVANRR